MPITDPKILELIEKNQKGQTPAPPGGIRKPSQFFDLSNYRPDTPPQTSTQAAEAMPNYDKLAPFERKLYEFMPKLGESSVGKALSWFGDTWVGKALGVLDVFAEGLERTSGFVAQANVAKENGTWNQFMAEIGPAWYAGSLAADFTNLPDIYRDENDQLRMTVPTELPGVQGLVDARKKIASGVPLTQVRDEYYNDLGALAIRSQYQDLIFHIFLDPLNYVLPFLKPVESAQKARKLLMARKASDTYIDTIKVAKEAAETGVSAAKAALKTAEEGGEVVYHATKADFEDLPKILDTLDDVAARRMLNEPEGVFYSTAPDLAKQATGYGEAQRIIEAEISAKKIFKVTDSNIDEFNDLYLQAAKNKGWDDAAEAIEDWMAVDPSNARNASKELTRLLREQGYEAVHKTRTGDFIALTPSAVRKIGEAAPDIAKAAVVDDVTRKAIEEAGGDVDKMSDVVLKRNVIYHTKSGRLSVRDIDGDEVFVVGHQLYTDVEIPFKTAAGKKGYINFDVIDEIKDASAGKIIWSSAKAPSKVAAAVGVAPDIAKLTEEVTKAEATLAAVVTEGIDLTKMTRKEKMILAITGGAEPMKALKKKHWWNPFELTPAARAHEYMTMVSDNIGTRILAVLDDPQDIVKVINSATEGSLGAKFGHAFMTQEGSTIQAILTDINSKAHSLYGTYAGLVQERESIYRWMTLLDEADFHKIADQVINAPRELSSRLAAKGVDMTEDALKKMGETIKDKPIEPGIFKVHLGNKIQDVAAEHAILTYGVEARGFLEKTALAVKSAETLAFLRLNPGYVVRNFLNNEVTMIARGMAGRVTGGDLKRFVEDIVGFEPSRMGQAYGMMGEGLVKETTVGSMVLQEALSGDTGFLDKFADTISSVNLGKFDMGRLASKVEKSASRRAFVMGYNQGWKMYWRPGKGYDYLKDFNPSLYDALNQIDKTIAPDLMRVVKSAHNEKGLDIATRKNLRLNLESVFDEASKRAGYNVYEVLPPEYAIKLENGLIDAAERGAVKDFMLNIRDELQEHLDEMTGTMTQKIAEDASNLIKTEGWPAVGRVWGDMNDEFLGGHMLYTEHMAELETALRGIGDPELLNKFWKTLKQRNVRYWNRAWNRFEAGVEGMKKAIIDSQGKLGTDDVKMFDKFVNLREDTEGFFRMRDKLQDKFFSARLKKKPAPFTWDEMQARITKAHSELNVNEKLYNTAIDQGIAKYMDVADKERYLVWRQKLSNLRDADRKAVRRFQHRVQHMNPSARQKAWAEFWQERYGKLAEMRDAERKGAFAMARDPRVEQETIDLLAANRAAYDQAVAAQKKVDAGLMITPEEEAARVRFINDHISPDQKKLQGSRLHKKEEYERFMKEAEEYKGVTGTEPPEGMPLINQLENTIKVDAWHKAMADALFAREMGGRAPYPIKGGGWWSNWPGGKEKNVTDAIEEFLKGKAPLPSTKSSDAFISGRHGVIEHLQDDIRDLIIDPNTGGEAWLQIDKMLAEGTIYDELGFSSREVDDLVDWYRQYDLDDWLTKRSARAKEGLSGIDEKLAANERSVFTEYDDLLLKQEKSKLGDMSLTDFRAHVPETIDNASVQDKFWLGRGFNALDNIEVATVAQAAKKPLLWDDIPDLMKVDLEKYITHVKGQMSDVRYATVRFAEFKRDAALLNYNRRFNYNTYLGMLAPYEFWFTQTMAKWAVHSLDRPAMLTSYLRIKKFMDTAGAPGDESPTRLKGSIRIRLPFLPSWMGDGIFIDPMRMTLPFDTLFNLPEQWIQDVMGNKGATNRAIDRMVEDSEISPEAADEAKANQSGDIWESAQSIASADKESKSAWDFMAMAISPHAPLQWAYEALTGTPEDIQPFTPMTRFSKGAAGTMGLLGEKYGIEQLEGVQESGLWPHNIEANVRRHLGLPGFDKWEDYRVDRMLSSMVAMNQITVEQATRAMIEREGEIYESAYTNAEREYGPRGVASFFGLPAKVYTEGEEEMRNLQDDYYRAYEQDDEGAFGAVQRFWEMHPEYETRMALWKSPEERLQRFVADEIWTSWNKLNSLDKRMVKDQLGKQFAEQFINPETQNIEGISVETMQMWSKLLGGDPPGTLNSPVIPLEFAPQDISYRAQTFYNVRKTYFPNYYDLQKEYHDLPPGGPKADYLEANPRTVDYWNWREGFLPNWYELQEAYYELPKAQRKAYLNENPALPAFWDERRRVYPDYKQLSAGYKEIEGIGERKAFLQSEGAELEKYWEWRDDFFHRNPEVVPYLNDDYELEYPTQKAEWQAQQMQPNYSWPEWQQTLTPSLAYLVEDYLSYGEILPPATFERLDEIAAELGIDTATLMQRIGMSLQNQQ
jgi:hypothetical protein